MNTKVSREIIEDAIRKLGEIGFQLTGAPQKVKHGYLEWELRFNTPVASIIIQFVARPKLIISNIYVAMPPPGASLNKLGNDWLTLMTGKLSKTCMLDQYTVVKRGWMGSGIRRAMREFEVILNHLPAWIDQFRSIESCKKYFDEFSPAPLQKKLELRSKFFGNDDLRI